jgi:hypothetical protein
MIIAFAAIALAGEPPPGVAGQWRLSRVETAEEAWEYATKVEEWAKFARDRCHEIERLLTFRGEEIEISYRWSCSEPGLGTYVSVRSLSVAAQWSGGELIVPPAEGFGRFVRLQPPDPTLGRRTVAILPATEREAQLGPMTWQVVLVEPPPRSKDPIQLRLTRKSGEVWTLVPATPPAEPPK